MKRFAVLLLALLLLTACGRAVPEAITTATTQAPTTSEPETTTEEVTTIPALPSSGESNGVQWRTLDLMDE